MKPSVQPCAICSRRTPYFNYGVQCCNGCVLFFRRMMACLNTKRVCKSGGTCVDPMKIAKCKHCRFLKCLEVGMSHEPSKSLVSPVTFQKHDKLSVLINGLINLDLCRNNFFLHCEALNDPTFDELVEDSKAVAFQRKSEHQVMSIFDWGFCQQVTTIEFLKHLEFAKSLAATNLNDLKILIRATFFKTSILYNAFRSFIGKQQKMVFPDGSDVMPEELHAVCPELLNQIRCRLIGKFGELRITKEEFLMLIVLFLLANPVVTDLSEEGKKIIGLYKDKFTSALFQYCQINYQRGGPSRFNDLIFVCNVANQTLEDFQKLAMLTMLHGPVKLPKKLFEAN